MHEELKDAIAFAQKAIEERDWLRLLAVQVSCICDDKESTASKKIKSIKTIVDRYFKEGAQ